LIKHPRFAADRVQYGRPSRRQNLPDALSVSKDDLSLSAVPKMQA